MQLEARIRGCAVGLLAVLAATGFGALADRSPSFFMQSVQLAHAAVGLLAIGVGGAYLALHLTQTAPGLAGAARAVRLRWLAVAAGVAATVSLVFVIRLGSGAASFPWLRTLNVGLSILWFALPGRALYLAARLFLGRDSNSVRTGELAALVALIVALSGFGALAGAHLYGGSYWSPRSLHIATACLLLVFLATHLATARRVTRGNVDSARRSYPWRRPLVRIAMPLAILLGAGIVITAQRVASATTSSSPDERAILPLERGFSDLVPSGCWYCHPDATEGWRTSSHALAAVDPVFTAIARRLFHERGAEAATYCLRCHAPHALDPTKASSFEEVVQSEGYRAGVHCESCHRSTPGTAHGNGSMQVAPLDSAASGLVTESALMVPPRVPSRSLSQPGGLTALARSLLFEASADVLVLSRVERHRERFRFGSRDPVSCAPCHVQTLSNPTDGRMNDAIQDQFDSWAHSSFGVGGPDCKSCHAPRFLSSGDYSVADHRFLAANTYLAGLGGGKAQVAAVRATLEGDMPAAGLPVGDPVSSAERTGVSLLAIDARLDATDGATRVVIRTRSNGRIGHSFPNGPSDLLEVWLAVRVRDATGRVQLEDGWDGHPGTMRLGHELLDANGEELREHRLWAVRRVVDRGAVPPDGVLERAVALPDGDPALPLRVEVSMLYRRLDPELVERLTDASPPELPIVTLAHFDGTLE